MRKITTPEEFVSARIELDITGDRLADLFCTSPRTIRNMEAGDGISDAGRFPLFCRILEWMLNTGFRPPEFKGRISRRGRPTTKVTK